MYGSRPYQQPVTLARSDDIEFLLYRAVLAFVVKFLCGNLPFETHVYFRLWRRVHYIPHLAFPQRVVSLFRGFIVRMDLQRGPPPDVEEFHEYWELSSIKPVDILSGNPFDICVHDFPERVAGKPSVCRYGIGKSHVGYFPAFTYAVLFREPRFIAVTVTFHELFTEFPDECIASPRLPFCDRDEFQRVQFFLVFHCDYHCCRKDKKLFAIPVKNSFLNLFRRFFLYLWAI